MVRPDQMERAICGPNRLLTPVPAGSLSAVEVTTVADDEVVVLDGGRLVRFDGLAPGETYEFGELAVQTLPRPGELLSRVATVNDVHFGETECGVIAGTDIGPTFRTEPGDDPYPEVMNRGAIAEIVAI